MIREGIENSITITVDNTVTAKKIGSGVLEVFATPAMIALIERTCSESVSSLLEDGCSTVGTAINAEHLSATPTGMKVTCKSLLVSVDRKALTFTAEVIDECGLIGKATHTRFIVNNNKFVEKTYAKQENNK